MENDSRIKDIVYKRRNGEPIVNDPEAIKSCKTEQSRDVIDNARLGSYDKYGNYIIIPDIKRELISMPKLVYNTYHNNGNLVYDLKGAIPIFGDVFFKLTMGKHEAKLSITESVNREAGGYLEVYDETIDSLALGEGMPSSIVFRTYSITDKPDDYGKRENYAYNNILTRKVYLNLLSKELRKTSNLDEHTAFEKMVSTLKQGGEYGKRVLNEFVDRLKERPAVFEIDSTDHYNKALNEVLLSSLDISTTEADRADSSTRATYLSVLNARNENIEEELRIANSRVDEAYVQSIVKKAAQEFDGELLEDREESVADEFFSKLSGTKSSERRRTLEKPVLKQGKGENEEEKAKTKEEKIKDILDKKQDKKTPAGKKLKAAKGKTAAKKLKAKGKGKGKSAAKGKGKKKVAKKGKLKGKKKKVKKAKAPAKAKGKVLTAKPKAAEKKKKKVAEKSIHMRMGPLLRQSAVRQAISSTSSTSIPTMPNVREVAAKIKQEPTKDHIDIIKERITEQSKLRRDPREEMNLNENIKQGTNFVNDISKVDQFEKEVYRAHEETYVKQNLNPGPMPDSQNITATETIIPGATSKIDTNTQYQNMVNPLEELLKQNQQVTQTAQQAAQTVNLPTQT